MQWPIFFPDNCPPKEATPASGIVYRIITEKGMKPLKYKHFRSHRERQPRRIWPPGISECCLCSVSICADYADAMKLCVILINRVPAKSKRKVMITEGTLTPDLGITQHTPDEENELESHYDWWIPEGEDPSPNFQYSLQNQVEQ